MTREVAQPTHSQPLPVRPLTAALLAALLATSVTAAQAQSACYQARDPATPVPECVRTVDGHVADCGSPGTVRLWPEGFRPGVGDGRLFDEIGTGGTSGLPIRSLKALHSKRDTTERRSGIGIPGGSGGEDDYHKAVGFAHDKMFVAYNAGLSVWDIGGANAETPLRLGGADGWNGNFASFPPHSEQLSFIDDLAVIEDAGTGATIFLAGKAPVGPSIWNVPNGFSDVKQRYQDVGSTAIQTIIVTHNGTRYGIGISERDFTFYNISKAATLNPNNAYPGGCIDNKGSNGACGGVYIGSFPISSLRGDAKVVGNKLFVTHSWGGRAEIYEFALPLTASSVSGGVKRWTGTDLGTGYKSPTFFTYKSDDYLALIKGDNRVEVYDASCLATNGCANGVGTALWSDTVPGTASAYTRFLTFSMSNSTPFLYFGTYGMGAGNNNASGRAVEGLWNLTNLTPNGPSGGIPEITDGGGTYTDPCTGKQVDYWSRYYPSNSYGLNEFQPFMGKFNGNYFYRAAQSVLEVHVLGDGGNAAVPRITTTAGHGGPYWFGVPVPFSASAQNCSGAETWAWGSDNTAATGLGSTTSAANITWTLCGSLHCPDETAEVWALKSACATDPDLVQTTANITLSDPRPHITAVSGPGVGNIFPLCTELQFSATVGGRTPIARNWSVRRVGGTGQEDLPTGSGDTFTWDTTDVVLSTEMLIDGFESGDLSAWSSVTGVDSIAYAPAQSKARAFTKAISQDFEVLLNATNGHGADTETLLITLTSLGDLAFSTPAITAVDLGGGSYRFTANTLNATEWRWELEDPGNGGTAGCQIYSKCVVLDFSNAQTIEYAWTPPNQGPAIFRVTVTGANCNDTVGLSRQISVNPAVITAPEPPTVQSFTFDYQTSGCSYDLFSGPAIGCPGKLNQPLTFDIAFADATQLEFDWDGNGTWDQTVAATAKVTHTYSTAQTGIRPRVRAKNSAPDPSATAYLLGYLTVN